MALLYKPDWEQVKERLKMWWNHEYFGRCVILIYAKRDAKGNPPVSPEKIGDSWFDCEYLKKWNEYHFQTTYFGGEAIPLWMPKGNPVWTQIPLYMDAKFKLDDFTIWTEPIIDKGNLTDYDYRKFIIKPDNYWWVTARKMQQFIAEESKGKSIPMHLGPGAGSGDTLAALRSTEKLLYDLMDCPEYVAEFDRHLLKLSMQVYDTFYRIVQETSEGATSWYRIWTPGKSGVLQNDFAYMISPKMFINIFLPIIEMQTRFYDYSVYHLDGVGNFAHVDALCQLPRLHAIDVIPGEGKPSPLYYMDVLKKVQSAGKNLRISIKPDEVKTALENLSARGLMIITECNNEEEAKALVKCCEKWSKDDQN